MSSLQLAILRVEFLSPSRVTRGAMTRNAMDALVKPGHDSEGATPCPTTT